jgi:tol-pal system protein YbgF
MVVPLILPSCITTQEDILYLNDQIRALNARLTRIEKDLGSDMSSLRNTQAEAGADIDKLKNEIQGISGRVEDNRELVRRAVERDTTEQDNMKTRVSEMSLHVAELESRVKIIQEYLKLESGVEIKEKDPAQAPAAETTAPVKPARPARPEATSEEDLYNMTLATYKEGRYEEAIAGFKGFIAGHPKSDLSDNAQFWVGECHMALKEYEQAILAFQEVIKRYPKGNKVPNAMLRQALAFYEIKDKTSSRLLLKKIIKEFPGTSEAKIAKAKLKTIK